MPPKRSFNSVKNILLCLCTYLFSNFEIILIFFRIGQYTPYGNREPLYGVAEETFFVENKLCSRDPYTYDSCAKFDEIFPPFNPIATSGPEPEPVQGETSFSFANPIATSRQGERSFSFARPTCRPTCL